MKIKGAGIGLRYPHLQRIIDERPKIDWLEVHSENFFYDSFEAEQLAQIAQHYPLSFHSIGLSLGSNDALNPTHLQNLKNAVERFKPDLISDHLSWSSIGGNYINDLLPLPYTRESLRNFTDKVKQVQDLLGRQILIENPSSYLQFKESEITEWDFFAALPNLCGCGLLLDVNNIFVSCFNHHYKAENYLNSIDAGAVMEIHLAGHCEKKLTQGVILIDDHGSRVAPKVWDLYQTTLKIIGNKPTLIEWDSNIPDLSVLLDEAQTAQGFLDA